MKLPLTLILLGSTLSAAAQTPMAPPPPTLQSQTVRDLGSPVLLVAEDEDDEDGGWLSFGSDDDSGGEDCDEDDGDDEENCAKDGTGGSGNPAPAGSKAPPANGLFGDGKAPKASTN
jgi:hypothetical protein